MNADVTDLFDAIVVGGGPSGATAATDLARAGHRVVLLDKAGRIKPCGGAIPPRLIRDFDIPDHLICARARSARVFAPSGRDVDMPIENGFVGMVDRDVFDEWLRIRASEAGAIRVTGTFSHLTRERTGAVTVHYRPRTEEGRAAPLATMQAQMVIGADGARSAVARAEIPDADRMPCVFAYHEVIEAPEPLDGGAAFDGDRCDIYYEGELSPDFYAWVFPHGHTASVGTGSANKGFSLRGATGALRERSGLATVSTIRREGAPIPLRPLDRWDNARDVLLAGDAAGVVAPASGEGIYYAMLGGRLAAEAADAFLQTRDARDLGRARKRFMSDHGRIFWVLRMMQHFWYANDKRRERFVSMCSDRDVQRLTWEAYMNKRLVRGNPLAHAKIFAKDVAHLLGIVRP